MSSSPKSSSIWPAKAATRAAAALLAAAVLAAAPGCADRGTWVERRHYAMGTWVDTIYRTDTAAQAALPGDIDARLQQFSNDYYAWADGELGHLNAALRAGDTFTASPELADLLVRAQDLSARSEGFFDPGVGELVEAWGFHTAEGTHTEPAAEFLERWRRAPRGIAALHIDGNQISSDVPLIVDLGGIAKGEIVDRLLERFRNSGIGDVLIDAGGDVRVRGRRGERSWRIGIQAPRDAASLLGSIPLYDGEAAFTSGDYERFYETDTGRRHHLIDPRSGMPATHTQAVTVIAGNGALADAAATAIFVAGPEHWQRIAAQLNVDLVLRVDADGTIEMTRAMRERIRMQGREEPATMPVQP